MPGNAYIMKQHAAKVKRMILTLPPKAGAVIVAFSKQRFIEKSWVNLSTEVWAPRKINNRGSVGRGLLIKSGRLRRSIRVIRTNTSSVTVGSDVPYAAIHNNGFRGTISVEEHTRNVYTKSKQGTGVYSIKTKKERMRTIKGISGQITVKSHTRQVNMPRRRYLGNSMYLNKQISRMIASELMRIK